MTEPGNTPFPHTPECKTPTATPVWYAVGNGHYERVCTCRKEISYPPAWRRPDIFDPAVMLHGPKCGIADKPEMLKLAVTVKETATYTFANCTVCTMNWYAWDAPPEPVGAAR